MAYHKELGWNSLDEMEIQEEGIEDPDLANMMQDIAKGSKCYISLKAIGWENEKHRDSWKKDFYDEGLKGYYGEWYTIRRFYEESLMAAKDKNVWLSIGYSEPNDWVAKEGGRKELDWHAWAVALIKDKKNPSKRHLVIFDNHPEIFEEDTRLFKSTMLRLQKNLVNLVRRGWIASRSPTDGHNIYYCQKQIRPDGRECVSLTLHWLKWMASLPDEPLDIENDTNDKRLDGFRHWKRM